MAVAANLDVPMAGKAVRADDPVATTAPRFTPRGGVTAGQLRLRAMECAFLPSGGLVSGNLLSHLLRHGLDQPISKLARWIVDRHVLSFEIDGQIWLPMFQFDPSSLRLLPAVQLVIDELRDVFDAWELSEWFARPNSLLGGGVPASVVARDGRAVLQAARLDRFVAAG
jgi:hypothetical protein